MPFFTAVAANQLPAATYNANVRDQVITTCTSGTRPATPVEGQTIYETDTDLLLTYSGAAWVPFAGPISGGTSFTPQIDQGASTNIAKTVNYSDWCYFGFKRISWAFDLALTAGGTAGSLVSLTVPATMANQYTAKGAGQLFDTSASTTYGGMWSSISTTLVAFGGDWSGTGAWGASPNLAVASGDILRGEITFKIA